jgi:tRNA-2-methylthio-N6-dimethylallyladenosine synthase
MHRGYTVERYLDRIAAARAAIPDLAVTTDLIVGFPGETDLDFQETLDAIEAARFDAAYTFVFSPRPGTPAAEMTSDTVAPDVVAERMTRLTEAVERHALAHNVARIGRVEEVLVEGESKKDPRRRSGRTRQGKLVHFEADEHRAPAGTLLDVMVGGAAPHWLAGELAADDSRSGRTRIPVTAA